MAYGYRYSVKGTNGSWASVNNLPEAVAIAERWFVKENGITVSIIDRNGSFPEVLINSVNTLKAAKAEYPMLVEA
jgi:hypothetical protein